MTENIQEVWNPLGPQASKTNIGVALPATGIDGEEFLLVDDLTAPTNTQRYRWLDSIPGSNKWFAVGGAGPSVSGPAGVGQMWFSSVAPLGYAILDGSTLVNAQTNYPKLWANVDTAWKSGSDIILPDLRGRMPVGLGTHADVDTLGKSDGVAVGTRRPKHSHAHTLTLPNHGHSITDPGHFHSFGNDGGGVSGPGGGAGGRTDPQNTDTKTTGITVGNPTTSPAINGAVGAVGMTDSAAYVVVNWIIKLA